MDLVSAVFASYIDVVSNNIQSRLTDQFGTQLQSRVVQYDGYNVNYTYQLWRLQKQSVCTDYKRNAHNFASCTVAAKAMSKDMCGYLQTHPERGWRYTKTRNMYCNAANTYQPTIASVTFDEKSDVEKNREACSVATLKLLEENSAKNRKRRDSACSEDN